MSCSKQNKNNKQTEKASIKSDANASKIAESDESFTVVSYSKKKAAAACGGVTQRDHRTTTKAAATMEKIAMDNDAKVVTTAKFSAFQKMIFPIISHIMANMDNPRDKFYTRWQQVQSGSNAVTENSTFRT
jgi:hypothetical protein